MRLHMKGFNGPLLWIHTEMANSSVLHTYFLVHLFMYRKKVLLWCETFEVCISRESLETRARARARRESSQAASYNSILKSSRTLPYLMKVSCGISAWLHKFVRQFQRECCRKPWRKVEFRGSKPWPDSHCNGCIESTREARTLAYLKIQTLLTYCVTLYVSSKCQYIDIYDARPAAVARLARQSQSTLWKRSGELGFDVTLDCYVV